MRGPAKSKKEMRGSTFLLGAGPHATFLTVPSSAFREKAWNRPSPRHLSAFLGICKRRACPRRGLHLSILF
jgi:hypothetical protein